MDVENIPVLGKIHSTMRMLIVNFVFLGFICLILGVSILVFPKVLDVLVASLLIVSSLIFFNIGYSIHSYKKKGFGWIEDEQ